MSLRFAVLAIGLSLTAPAALAKTLTLDTQKSQIKWKGEKKLVDSPHNGTMKFKSGTIETDAKGEVTGGEFLIDMASLENVDLKDKAEMKAKLEGHLKSDDFFDVAKHPTAKFVVKSVASGANGKHRIKGDLTIRGKTSPVEFDTTIKAAGNEYVAMTENFTIDRTKYDVKYNSEKFFNAAALGDKIIKDDMIIALDLVAR